jgi:hypothetical protein
MDDRIELLDTPRRINPQLAGRLPPQATTQERWETAPPTHPLAALVLLRFEELRRQLNDWWDELIDPDHKLLIEHRNDDNPPEQFTEFVEAEAHEIGQKPEMVLTYIEIEAIRRGQS